MAVSTACGPSELIVGVDTDLVPGIDFARVEVIVTGGDVINHGPTPPEAVETFDVITDGSTATEPHSGLPFSFGVAPLAESVSVVIRARDANDVVVVEQRRTVRFVEGETKLLAMHLALDCVGVGQECTYAAETTCEAGRCVGVSSVRLVSVSAGNELRRLQQPPTLETRVIQRSCDPETQSACGVSSPLSGTFTFGSTDLPDTSPPNPSVSVSSFRIDTHEVTIDRFAKFLDVLARSMRGRLVYPDGSERLYAAPTWPNHEVEGCARVSDALAEPTPRTRGGYPMTCVTWETAQAFCAFDGGRLPTSAEWEFAARWGRDDPALLYPWGNTPPSNESGRCTHAWYDGCLSPDWSRTLPMPAGELETGAARPVGAPIFDLAGNVAELTADRFEPVSAARCWKPDEALVDPSCPIDGLDEQGGSTFSSVIVRGGAIVPIDGSPSGLESLRVAAVIPYWIGRMSPYVGFRCAYDAAP